MREKGTREEVTSYEWVKVCVLSSTEPRVNLTGPLVNETR